MTSSKKYTMRYVNEIASEKGGECLSVSVLRKQKLLWRCKERHIWETTPKSVKNGSWCPVCYKQKLYENIKILSGK